MIVFLINVAMCAINVAFYVEYGYWWNLIALIVSGAAALFCLAMETAR